jgi:hypothetical protein
MQSKTPEFASNINFLLIVFNGNATNPAAAIVIKNLKGTAHFLLFTELGSLTALEIRSLIFSSLMIK